MVARSAWAQNPPRPILIVGDSLSAEYGLKRGTGWVALLGERLARDKLNHPVVNASISGETSAGGRSRLGALLARHRPAVVVIELGGNDALRGLDLKATRDHLNTMAAMAQEAGAQVLLVGMQVPPNYGGAYTRDFASMFEQVARTRNARWVPFLLKGIADGNDPAEVAKWFQADRIHPNEAAQPRLLDNVWPTLRPLLQGSSR